MENNINKYIDIYIISTYILCKCYHSILMSANYNINNKNGDKHELSTIA